MGNDPLETPPPDGGELIDDSTIMIVFEKRANIIHSCFPNQTGSSTLLHLVAATESAGDLISGGRTVFPYQRSVP